MNTLRFRRGNTRNIKELIFTNINKELNKNIKPLSLHKNLIRKNILLIYHCKTNKAVNYLVETLLKTKPE